ncbi:complex I NDUFA9 subunit family protein [Candidatus Pelagibacter sp.]|nr:complex I NDUFA9 subunit family protein [Candidatus Pelagibacter sp.]
MKQKEILVFGATGQIGRNLVRKLTQNNYKIVAVTRNIHRAGYILKTQANPGYLDLIEIKNFNYEKIKDLIKNCSICINLIGILYEKKKNQFKTIHTDLPDMLSKIAFEEDIEKFIHLSALGVELAENSKYASSKKNGEDKIIKNFKRSIIIKPSIVYSVDDKFTTRFMTLLSRLPVMPLYYNGNTKFRPIHVSDIIEVIFRTIHRKHERLILECVGPEVLSFKKILQNLLMSMNKKRILLPLPYPIAKISAKILQLLPNPLLTEDQLNLLKFDNINTGLHKTNFDINIDAKKLFRSEIDKYSYNWKTGGQFNYSTGDN